MDSRDCMTGVFQKASELQIPMSFNRNGNPILKGGLPISSFGLRPPRRVDLRSCRESSTYEAVDRRGNDTSGPGGASTNASRLAVKMMII